MPTKCVSKQDVQEVKAAIDPLDNRRVFPLNSEVFINLREFHDQP